MKELISKVGEPNYKECKKIYAEIDQFRHDLKYDIRDSKSNPSPKSKKVNKSRGRPNDGSNRVHNPAFNGTVDIHPTVISTATSS